MCKVSVYDYVTLQNFCHPTVPQLDQISDEDDHNSDKSEAEGNESTDDYFTNLFDLTEAANLIDSYNADRDIISFLGDFTLFTPNISPQKCKHF